MSPARRAAEWPAVTVASVLLALTCSVLLARSLGPDARGQHAVFTTAVGILVGLLSLRIGTRRRTPQSSRKAANDFQGLDLTVTRNNLLVMLDFHNHLMPDVDDGAANIDESGAGLRAMEADGITQIITTPHISASLSGVPLERYLERIERGWDQLQTLAATEFPKLRLQRGFEVMLDTPHPVLDNPLLRLAGTQFVLVEFPFMSIPPNSAYAVRELRDAGWIPVVAHPERYSNMESAMHLIEQWRDAGAYLQVNAGSFLGVYGARAKRLVWQIVGDGHAEYLCSDYHSRGKCNVAAAHSELRESGADSQSETMISNGLKLLKGERPSSVDAMIEKPKPGWKKVFPWI